VEESAYESAVALVGMSGRFPGAGDVDALWANLRAGVRGLREIRDEELAAAGVDPGPGYVKVGGPVDGIDRFDAAAFGFTAREAETMEPQHRLFLECSWEALERAGYCPTDPGAAVGVFAGCAFPDYMIANVFHLTTEPGAMQLFSTGNERDSLTSLVSYKLGLRGPSLTVQTFCSTSLVAVHLACQSLLTYECDMALAGGAFLPLPQPAGYRYEEGGILSPDGQVRALDAAANGTVMGSGVGVVALKRMADALADGDVIHAVILGSAVNNDGRERAGYTAPGVEGQAAVVESALAVAGVKPESVGYVECHAVGTPMGDSIEFAALGRVFPAARPTPCVLSSVKPSVGHLDRAAGVTGLMRAALSLRHAVLPGTAGFETPNPALPADRFTVLAEDRPWPAGPEPRRAGVSAFGMGGTNAHVVLEEAPPRAPRPAPPGPHLLTFSAAGSAALDALTERLRARLAADPSLDLADVAYTLQISRGRFALRRAVVCRDVADAVAALGDPARWIDGETRRRDPAVRLVAAPDVPGPWWAELAQAASRLLPDGGPAPTAGEALAVLGEGLARLGVRVREDAAEEIVIGPSAGAHGEGLPRRASSGTALEAPGASPAECVLATVARLWQAGATIDWAALHGGAGRRVELPTYPFQRSRYWVEPVARSSAPRPPQGLSTYVPTWRQLTLPVTDFDARLRAAGPWLVLAADARGEALAARLVLAGAEAVVARPGTSCVEDEYGNFTVRPADLADLAELLRSQIAAPRTIVHAFGGHASASALVAAVAADGEAPPARLLLLTSGAAGVIGADLTRPEEAAVGELTPSRPELTCRHIDVDPGAVPADVLAASLAPDGGPLAVRGAEIWQRRYEPCPFPTPDPDRPVVLPGETVLITGGMDAAGLAVARHLAGTYGCRLVLTTPAGHHTVHELEAEGATVLAIPAAPGDEAALREAVRAAVDAFGGIDAVVAADIPDAPAFRALHAALGDQAASRRVVFTTLGAGAEVAACARMTRARGGVRWTTAEWGNVPPTQAPGLLDRLLAAGPQLAHVTLSADPLDHGPTPNQPGDPAPQSGNRPRPALSTPYVEPTPGPEQTIADLWATILNLESVGAEDNFFELGGRSLTAVHLATRVGEALGVSLPPTALVEHPTIRLLAAVAAPS
jgi:acyl transferase domain-containing protein/acyl carrier protein